MLDHFFSGSDKLFVAESPYKDFYNRRDCVSGNPKLTSSFNINDHKQITNVIIITYIMPGAGGGALGHNDHPSLLGTSKILQAWIRQFYT